ncbi:hypothetical protein SAMN04487957_10553 [Halomonas shengliensis]|uniref:Uncharacterized protein n=1 Tax=Halomonas shengliensis TaxID=419597 RepID=A0A1H0IAY8_9GAMM|nr:hypothetical protein [Halomonas shengliensis]SDO28619.1 hypothetical protein SAMN04487957_10553 [Halomonas shengliensis]
MTSLNLFGHELAAAQGFPADYQFAKATGQALPSDFLPQSDTKRIKGD